MNRIFFLIGIGSFLGGVSRYYSSLFLAKYIPSAFPFGTLFVNLVGCLLIGIFYGLSERTNILTPEWRLFLTTGFCGGFTTFSTFSYESINLMQGREFYNLSLYVTISVVAGFAATFLGITITKTI